MLIEPGTLPCTSVRWPAKVGCPSDYLVLEVDGEEDDDIVEMRDSAVDLVNVVGYEHIAFFDGTFPAVQELRYERSRLPYQHFAGCIGDDVEFVLLLTNGRTHSAA